MKRLFLTLVALSVLGAGGFYFVAETVILPRQEEVWRDLVADLPGGLKADFKDVDFSRAGLRLSIGGATVRDGNGNAVRIAEVVAENSVPTAIGNVVRFVLGKEEERYDSVRFLGVAPLQPEMGFNVEIREMRLIDVAIGIDSELPSIIKSLTGAINLDRALETGRIGGYEVHGLSASNEGLDFSLDRMLVHGISATNIGRAEISKLTVTAGLQTLAALELFRTVNLNVASLVDPVAVLAGAQGQTTPSGDVGGLASSNIFHVADEFVLVGFEVDMGGFGGISVKRMMYQEEATRTLPDIGIVPTRTFSEIRDFSVRLDGLAMFFPDAAAFMNATQISSLELNGEGDNNWDLDTGAYGSSGWSELTDLIKVTSAVELGQLYPADIVKALELTDGLANLEGATFKPGDISRALVSAEDIVGQITLAKVDVLIENKSLIERLYQYGEVALGMPQADLKALVDGTLMGLQVDPSLPPALVGPVEAMQTFVQDPVSLHIVVAPPVEVSIEALMNQDDPERALDMLGLSVTANGQSSPAAAQ